MPLEVKELRVKVTVDTNPGQPAASPVANVNGNEEAMIRRIVEQVLRVLEEKKQR